MVLALEKAQKNIHLTKNNNNNYTEDIVPSGEKKKIKIKVIYTQPPARQR